MRRLLALEFLKLKGALLNILLLCTIFLPILIIVIQYMVSKDSSSFFSVVATNSTVISLSIFSVVIILASYIVAREYKDNTITYLLMTPNSRTKILVSKLIMLFISILLIESFTFAVLLATGYVLEGLSISYAIKFLETWVKSSVMYFLLTSVVVYIALVRRNFVSSLLIPLIALVFTSPFIYKETYIIFPHLIPIVAVSNTLGVDLNQGTNNPLQFIILFVVFIVFLFLSIRKFSARE